MTDERSCRRISGYPAWRFYGRWVLVVGSLGLLVVKAYAAEPKRERLPFFGHIANAKENSALSMDCEGDPLGTIDCSFTQVTVSVRGAAEVEKARTEMKAEGLTPSQRAEIRSTCSKMKAAPPETPPQRAALTQLVIGRFARACACRDDRCFDRELIEALAAGERKCKIWTHTFEARLNRVLGQRKWVGMSEATGICQAVNATVVESDEKGLYWTFTQTRLTAFTESS